MTREEAIIDLNALKFILDNDQYTDRIEEALNIGISALEQTEKAQLSGEAATSDCISRQAAIEIVDFECGEWRGLAETIEKRLSGLPSAQPQYEELTLEEAASEIASGSTMSAWYWLDDMIRLKQMGYAICRKR